MLVGPICRTWAFVDKGFGDITYKMSRSQLPIVCEAACPLYSLQGATCDPGGIAHFVMPRQADHDIRWLIVYVLLSRVRSLSRLRSVGLASKVKDVIEAGAPSLLTDNFDKLFRANIETTKKAAEDAKAALKWH